MAPFRWISTFVLSLIVRRKCRMALRSAGYSTGWAPTDWKCNHCGGRLEEILSARVFHTHSGETFRYPTMISTCCTRCFWISDGASKVPIWKWLERRNKGPGSREFLLQNERKGLKMRLAEIERELAPKPTLLITDGFKSLVEDLRERTVLPHRQDKGISSYDE